jgi:5-methylcytosine-specific restriction endonuclease McrA
MMRTLVLNAGYEPLAVVSFRRAVVLVLTGKATVLAAHADEVVSTSSRFTRPSVIILRRYIRAPYSAQVPVSRRGVLRRDSHRCVYCGSGATTVDHVMPRSRGGASDWENIVTACAPCNRRKGNRTPVETGMHPRRAPRAPGPTIFIRVAAPVIPPGWQQYLV